MISDITPKEYMAINEFMKLAKLTSENHQFSLSICNTGDPELTQLGKKLSDQIKNFSLPRLDNNQNDDDDDDDDDPVINPKRPVKTTLS